jgi:hypothetical protein
MALMGLKFPEGLNPPGEQGHQKKQKIKGNNEALHQDGGSPNNAEYSRGVQSAAKTYRKGARLCGLEFFPQLSMKCKTPGKIMSLGGEAPETNPTQNQPQNRHSKTNMRCFLT